ncbi:MAG: hypothetical protein NXH85_16550 [Pseudomonadaceae bacterium]|nr:hypothetical protein [Pseudomonadaceae bacterium]
MSAIATEDSALASTGWFAVSVDNSSNSSAAIQLAEHMTLGVDDLGERVLTSAAATHACRVRSDRGMLRIEPLRGDVRLDGRVIGARALLSRSSVLRLGEHAFFISDSLLVEEPVEVVNELPGYWQPFMEELEAIPEPGTAAATEKQAQPDKSEPSPGRQQRSAAHKVASRSAQSTPTHSSARQRNAQARPRAAERRRIPPRRAGRTWLPITIAGLITAGVITATAIVADPAGTPAQIWRSVLAIIS